MASFTSIAEVRAYLGGPANSSTFTDGIIGSNIVVASNALQRRTNRQFEQQLATTKKFTTRGRASLTIPDLASASAVTLNSSALTADSSYYLIPDVMNTGTFTAIDLPQYRQPFDYRSYPDWFDKNYDSPLYQARLRSGIPNDLSIAGTWGYATIPPEVSHATKVLAAWLTKQADAILGNTVTPDGNLVISDALPAPVRQFIGDWRIPLDEVASL